MHACIARFTDLHGAMLTITPGTAFSNLCLTNSLELQEHRGLVATKPNEGNWRKLISKT